MIEFKRLLTQQWFRLARRIGLLKLRLARLILPSIGLTLNYCFRGKIHMSYS